LTPTEETLNNLLVQYLRQIAQGEEPYYTGSLATAKQLRAIAQEALDIAAKGGL